MSSSNKIIVDRLKGLISEYKVLDAFTREETEKVKQYVPFIEKCKQEQTEYSEVKDELAKFVEAQNNFKMLQDDIFGLANRVTEVSRILDILGEVVELDEESLEILKACKTFVNPVYAVEEGKVQIKDSEYSQYLKNFREEVQKQGNFLEKEYQAMLVQ